MNHWHFSEARNDRLGVAGEALAQLMVISDPEPKAANRNHLECTRMTAPGPIPYGRRFTLWYPTQHHRPAPGIIYRGSEFATKIWLQRNIGTPCRLNCEPAEWGAYSQGAIALQHYGVRRMNPELATVNLASSPELIGSRLFECARIQLTSRRAA